jgi:hypothetical protein
MPHTGAPVKLQHIHSTCCDQAEPASLVLVSFSSMVQTQMQDQSLSLPQRCLSLQAVLNVPLTMS